MPGQAPTESSIPNFLLKLWRLVEDQQFQNCIGWDETGYSFHVCEPYMFSKSVLPLYFKHSNLNSFIRQLNMYGFRKVNNFDKGTLKQQNEMAQQQTPQQQDILEFQHPYFVRGHAEMLQYIKRKVAVSSRLNGAATTNTAGNEHMNQSVVAGGAPVVNGSCVAYHSQSSVDAVSCPGLITGSRPSLREFDAGSTFGAYFVEDLRQMREKTSSLDVQVVQLRKENQALWNEVGSLRQNQSKQQGLVNNLIQILSSFAQGQQQQNKSRPSRGQMLAIERGCTVLGSRHHNGSNNSDIDENLVTTLKISDVTHEYETKKHTPKLCSGDYSNIRYNSDSSLNGNNVPNEKEDLVNGYSKVPSPNDSRISIYSNVSVENDSAMETDWTNTELPPKNALIDDTSNCDYEDGDDVNKLRNSLSTTGQRLRFDQETAANLFDLAENSNRAAKMGEEQYAMTDLRSSLLSALPTAAFFQRQASVPCYVSYATMPTNALSQTPPISAVAAHQRVGGRPAPAEAASADFHMATMNDGSNMEQPEHLNSCSNRRSSTPMNNYSCVIGACAGVMGDLTRSAVAAAVYRTATTAAAEENAARSTNVVNGQQNIDSGSMVDTGDDFSSFILSHFDAAQQNAAAGVFSSCNGNGGGCENAASGYY